VREEEVFFFQNLIPVYFQIFLDLRRKSTLQLTTVQLAQIEEIPEPINQNVCNIEIKSFLELFAKKTTPNCVARHYGFNIMDIFDIQQKRNFLFI
jgi:hypothetical protein